jgi:subtilisin family serine protease
MRKFVFILGLALLSITVNAQRTYYYYYKGEKQYLNVSPDKVLVRFTENTEANTVKAAIAKNTSFQVTDISKADKKGQHLVRFAGTDTVQTMQLTKQWKDSILYATPVFIDREGKEMAALTNQIIICLKQEADSLVLQESLANYAVYNLRQDEFDVRKYLFNVNHTSEKNAMEIANELYETGLFDFVEPDLLLFIEYHGEAIPNDTYFPYQWNLKNTGQYGGIPGIDIKATYAWDITTGDPSIKIAVLDDFVDPAHPDLIDNTLSEDLTGSGLHGTACAGICASRGNNAKGIAGVTHHCRLLFYDVGGYYQASSVVNAINRAVQDGARVISMSFNAGLDILLAAFERGLSNAFDSGCILVASAGNYDNTSIRYPAGYEKVIAVGAVNPWGERKSGTSSDTEDWGSNYGIDLDIMAPGVLIPTTDIQGDGGYNPHDAVHTRMNNGTLLSDEDEYADRSYTRWFAGTSSACPHVAGVAALVLSVNPNLTSAEVREIIESTAQKVRPDLYTYNTTNGRTNGMWNNEMGYGVVNAYAAVLKAMGCTDPAKLVVRDILSDEGNEPTMGADNLLWDSPDIWVRRSNDRGLTHQEPCLNDTNYIYVRVRNYGCQPSTGNEKLKLYWAKTDNSMPWPQHWQGNTYANGKPKGNIIGTFAINHDMYLTAGEEYTVIVPWYFPNPSDYTAISNQPGLFTLLAKIETTQGSLNETTDIIGNVRNNNKIAMKNVSVTNGIDLMIKDSPNDKGDEPHVNFQVETQSKQDIWVRHQPDNGLIHQNPKPDSINYIYVKVTNIGCEASTGNDFLKVYWAKGNTDMSFPYYWEGNNISGINLLSGNNIGTYPIHNIAGDGGEAIIEIPWQAPNPSDYFGLIEEAWNFYLLARIESENDIMTFPETADIENNVSNNNNIAWKRVDVTDKIDLMIRDTENDLGIEPNGDPDANLWDSPDIWVRHYADNIAEPQDPKPNTLNYVYVRVKNVGNTLSRGNEQLELYWAKGNPNLSWPSDWGKIITNIYDHMQVIDSIVSYDISTILPDGEAIIEIPWNVPNPLDFCNTNMDDCSFLLLAMIKTDNDTLFYPLTENSYENVKNNNNIAWKKIYATDCVVKMDLMLRDDNNDTAGIEPNYNNTIGNSPDIWIRHTQDDGLTHQNPLPNDTNYIYVRIKNRGNAPSQESDILKLYWTKVKRVMQWDSSWTGGHFPQNGPLMGNLIDSIIIPVIPCQEDTIIVIPWHTPNPNNYCGIKDVNSSLDFHLLARIESQLDPIKYSETTDITNNIKRNNNIAMKSVNFLRRDLMIQDTEDDVGIEPNIDPIVWDSPDIWVFHYGGAQLQLHQNPIAGKTNKVYVQIKNIGCVASQGNEVLKLYWAKTGTSLAWDSCWNGNYFPQNGPLMGKFIDSVTIPSLSPSQETILQINWTNTPDPDVYSGISNNPSQFSLLARIEENGNYTPTLETEDLESNVRNNKNIAWKNVTVGKVDLMIRDHPADIGAEGGANSYNGNMWDSPDIMVSYNNPPADMNQFFNPTDHLNHIFVKIKNRGNSVYLPGSAKIKLYWSKTIENGWDVNWNFLGSYNIYDPIEPGEEQWLSYLWVIADYPEEYWDLVEYGHFYFLAVIQSDDEPISYTGNPQTDIKNNNNIAGKKINFGYKKIDLMVKDNPEDTGLEPNLSSDIFFQGADIWIRKKDNTGLSHENPINGETNCVRVRIKNIGIEPSLGTEKLYLHWSKSGTNLAWPRAWDGTSFFDAAQSIPVGGLIDSLLIPSLQPGAETILNFYWNVPDTSQYSGIDGIREPWHFCLLARIIAPTDPMFSPEINEIRTNVRFNNNIAQKNVTVVEPGEGSISGTIFVGNFSDLPHSYCLKFNAIAGSTTLTQEAEITVKIGDVLYQAWERGGRIAEGIQVKDNRTLLIKSANARLCNLILNPGEFGVLSTRFNFLTREITDQTNYSFHVIQTDYETDEVIGGEAYSIIKSSSRRPFYANAGGTIYAYPNETISLNAASIGEAATYNWYLNGNLVHTGMTFTIPAVIGRKYKLEIIATKDGYKDYAEVEIKERATGGEDNLSNLLIRNTEYDMGMVTAEEIAAYAWEQPEGWLWNSPDIWIRHEPDGAMEHQNPKPDHLNFVYIRLKNIGSMPSPDNEQLVLYWGKTATNLSWSDHYMHTINPHYEVIPMKNNFIGAISISGIPPGEEHILEIPWEIPSEADFIFHNPWGEPACWNFSLLARIEGSGQETSHGEDDIYYHVAYDNKMALKNVSILERNDASMSNTTIVGIGGAEPFNLVFMPDPHSESIYDETEIIVWLDDALYEAWHRGGAQGHNIEDIGGQSIKIHSGNASLKNLWLEPHELGLLTFQFNFFSTSQQPFTYHLIQLSEDDRITGGTAFQIGNSHGYYSFRANAGEDIYADKGDIIQLSAEQITEPAIYNWYDQRGNLIHEGIDFTTSVTMAQKYKLEVIALADSCKDTAEVNVLLNPSRIEEIFPNPATHEITVTYKLNEVENAYISVSNYYFATLYDNYILDTNSQSKILNLNNYTTGFYVITLVCDGVVTDMKTFIKH